MGKNPLERIRNMFSEHNTPHSKILCRTLSVPGVGWKRKDILDGDDSALAFLEEHLLESGGTYEDALFFAGGIGAVPPEKTIPLSPEESETRIGRSTLSLFLKNLKETGDADNRAVVFVEEVLSNSLNISEALGISEPSAACIRLVAGATALGAFGSEYEVPCSFWTDIVDDWKKHSNRRRVKKDFPTPFFRRSSSGTCCRRVRSTGSETFRSTARPDSVPSRGIVSKRCSRIRFLSRDVFFPGYRRGRFSPPGEESD